VEKLKKILSADWFMAVILFLVAVLIRALPEIKAGSWPIGYDTFNTYAAELATYHGPLINWLKTANILYFLFLPFKLLGLSPNWIMKIFGPILYGGLMVSFFIFVRNLLKFPALKAFVLTLLTLGQLAALRLSWDLYRNELGLIFLFWGLLYLPEVGKTKNLVLLTLLASLVSLSNELVTVLLIIILLSTALYQLIKRDWDSLVSLLIPLMIVLTLFTVVISSSGKTLYDPHVFFSSDKNYFWRYFYRYNLDMPYGLLKEIILGLFWLLYGYLLLFIGIGWWRLRRNLILQVITLWLLFGTFSALLFRGNGLMVWERWLFMLVFPFMVYAVEGIYFLGGWLASLKNWGSRNQLGKTLALILATVFWLVLLGLTAWRSWPFLTADYRQAKPPLANDELNSYFPRTMVHNSIGLWLIPDTIKAVDWLNAQAPAGSLILVDNRYRGVMLTRFNIDNRYILTNEWSETIKSSTLEAAKKSGFWPIYLIWNVSRGVPDFDRIYSAGDRGIYQALPSFKNSN